MEISVSLDPSSGKDLQDYLGFLNQIRDITIHLDVMDGVFVSRKSIKLDEFDFVVKNSSHKIDAHLMIEKPHENINRYLAKAVWGSLRSISFHAEALDSKEAVSLLNKIRVMGIWAGIVVDLPTRIQDIDKQLFENSDVITIMTVKCGKSGQSINLDELGKRVEFIAKSFPGKKIIVDGGVNLDNIEHVKTSGADIAVVGNAIYSAPNRKSTIQKLLLN